MSRDLKTYNPQDVIITIGGAAMSGFAEDTFVNVARDEQSFTKVVGADGRTSRSKTSNKSGTLTLTLMQTSDSNDVLSAYLAQDERSNDGTFSVLIQDNSGRTQIFSAVAWVQGMPAVEFGRDVGTREWVIELADIEFTIGGNFSVGGAD